MKEVTVNPLVLIAANALKAELQQECPRQMKRPVVGAADRAAVPGGSSGRGNCEPAGEVYERAAVHQATERMDNRRESQPGITSSTRAIHSHSARTISLGDSLV